MRTTILAALAAALLAACASGPEASSASDPKAAACKEEPRTGSNIVKRCSPANPGS